eukprot:364349-Chlamydomonas_euryale.AAC.18
MVRVTQQPSSTQAYAHTRAHAHRGASGWLSRCDCVGRTARRTAGSSRLSSAVTPSPVTAVAWQQMQPPAVSRCSMRRSSGTSSGSTSSCNEVDNSARVCCGLCVWEGRGASGEWCSGSSSSWSSGIAG